MFSHHRQQTSKPEFLKLTTQCLAISLVYFVAVNRPVSQQPLISKPRPHILERRLYGWLAG